MAVWRIRYQDRNGRVHSVYESSEGELTLTMARVVVDELCHADLLPVSRTPAKHHPAVAGHAAQVLDVTQVNDL